MKQVFLSVFCLMLAAAVVALSPWQVSAEENAETAVSEEERKALQIERGRYLAVDVAMCVQCHSPRDSRGRIIESQRFRGAPITVDSRICAVPFATRAPALAGLPGYEKKAFVQLMVTGQTKRGGEAMAPRPQYRFNQEDAEALEAYLSSLR